MMVWTKGEVVSEWEVEGILLSVCHFIPVYNDTIEENGEQCKRKSLLCQFLVNSEREKDKNHW